MNRQATADEVRALRATTPTTDHDTHRICNRALLATDESVRYVNRTKAARIIDGRSTP